MSEICGSSMIVILLKRLRKAKKLDQIVLATSAAKENALLVSAAKSLQVECFQGDEANVLDRFSKAAQKYNADIVVRITGDCPLVDSTLLDNMLDNFSRANCDYLTNGFPPTFPDGMDIEIFKSSALIKSEKLDRSEYNTEHVTSFRESGYLRLKTSTKTLMF